METVAPVAEQPAAEKTARWEDFMDIYIAPADLFRRRANDSWAFPIIALSIIGVAMYYAFLPITGSIQDAMMAEQMAARGATITPEAQAAMEQWGGLFRTLGGIFVPLGMMFFAAATASVAWVASKAFSADAPFRKVLAIASWTGFVSIIQQIAIMGSVFLANRGSGGLNVARDMSFGVARFVDVKTLPKAVLPLINRMDVFAIWQCLLLAIGLQVVCRLTRGQAYGIAFVVWIAYAIPGLIMALIRG